MTAINMFRTMKFATTNHRIKKVAEIHAVLYFVVSDVALNRIDVQFSLDRIWYIPKNEI